MSALRFGISTCPNDTFAVAALLEGRVDAPAIDFVLDDVERLNERLAAGELDVSKASFAAALRLPRSFVVLPVGAALGYGVGPLLVARDEERAARLPRAGDRVLCPGAGTTASLLYALYCGVPEAAQVVFSQILPALGAGEADYGVVIHEGRFVYEEAGLSLALDLGRCWEEENALPLPLGGILARASLGGERLVEVTAALRASLELALAEPAGALSVMKRHASVEDEEWLMAHVRLYVNETTRELGVEGRRALAKLAERVGVGELAFAEC